MHCERSEQVHRYHDGELPAGERDALEAHLKSCAECTELLRELQAVSRMFAGASMATAPDDAMQRIRAARYVLPDAGVLKIAGWLTAAAAAILLAALPVWRQEYHVEAPIATNTEVLDTVAVMPPGDNENSQNELVALAQWMSDDLSANERH